MSICEINRAGMRGGEALIGASADREMDSRFRGSDGGLDGSTKVIVSWVIFVLFLNLGSVDE